MPKHIVSVQLDQAHLETVLPSAGGTVMVLRGANKSATAKLESIDVDKFQARVVLSSGEKAWMEYEDICKLQS